MYWYDYIWFLVALGVCSVVAFVANIVVNKTFAKYNSVANSSGLTGRDTVLRILSANGVTGVKIGRVSGTLSDHYDPTDEVVNLSQTTHDCNTVGAVAVSAHEAGHVLQKHKGYLFYKIRTFLVPVVNFGSRLSIPLVIVGLLIDLLVVTLEAPVGFYVALVGVALYGGSLLFALVTLPVELNASRRASEQLVAQGILTETELVGAKKVLRAAAMTYVVSVLISAVYFLRFLVQVLTLFGRRHND